MKLPSLEEQRALVKQWQVTGPKLEALRRERLRGMPYVWQDVDALLALGDDPSIPSRTTSGLVEMQRLFRRYHEAQQARESGEGAGR